MKKQLFFLCAFVLLLSCSNNDDDTYTPKSIELDEKSASLVESDNEFGLELFQKIYDAETESDNIMISPLSVSLALAMTYNGAGNDTKTAMEETLKVYGLTAGEINTSYQTLVSALKSLDPKVTLEIANAIFYSDEFSVEDSFVTTNQDYYDAEVEALDFSSSDAVTTINDWVADNTNNKIEKIIDDISANQVMLLLNAIYFKGIWASDFDEDDTENLPFYLESGSYVTVPTMRKSETLPYYSNSMFQAVKLAYGYGNYSMYVFLPEEDYEVSDLVDDLADNWTTWMNKFSDSASVDLELPRFKYGYEIKLNNVLSAMGMSVAFDPSNADFSGINNERQLYIEYVKHKSFIEVNETGTEAAAVTAVSVGCTSAGINSNISFSVNRPFLYAITEKDTDAILFMGTVKNPESEE
jgi:serpin B